MSSDSVRWWSIQHIDNETPSLATLLGYQQEYMELILCYSNMGYIRKGGLFCFNVLKFQNFVDSYQLSEFVQYNRRSPRGVGTPKHFIMLGTKNKNQMRTCGQKGPNPSSSRSTIVSKFKNSVYKFVTQLKKGNTSNPKRKGDAV